MKLATSFFVLILLICGLSLKKSSGNVILLIQRDIKNCPDTKLAKYLDVSDLKFVPIDDENTAMNGSGRALKTINAPLEVICLDNF